MATAVNDMPKRSKARHSAEYRAERRRHMTDLGHSLGVASNLLAPNFSANHPHEKWAGDITYLRTIQGSLYLAVILDLCTRKVIGWATSTRTNAELAGTALRAALAWRGEPSGMIMHTDRGSVYCGWDHRNLIHRYELVASMSGCGNCYDNAVVEIFFHNLKVDGIHGVPLMHPEALRQALFEYIEVWSTTESIATLPLDTSGLMCSRPG